MLGGSGGLPLPSDFGRGAAGAIQRCPLCGFSVSGRSKGGEPRGMCCWKCSTDEGSGDWSKRSPPSWLLPKKLTECGLSHDAVTAAVDRIVCAVNAAHSTDEGTWRVADVLGHEHDVRADQFTLREAQLNNNVVPLYVRLPAAHATTAVRRGKLPASCIDPGTKCLRLNTKPPQGSGTLLRCYTRVGNTSKDRSAVSRGVTDLNICPGPHSCSVKDGYLIPTQQQVAAVEVVKEGLSPLVWALLIAFVVAVGYFLFAS
eukprot:Hpha_TRINITY_DN23667_c0_g1::TRINITY_DN23667_c0_g1_i1::g.57553::m.57553